MPDGITNGKDILGFIAAVASLRDAQKAYFKDRKQSDLVASKRFERDVDDWLARLMHKEITHADETQARLL